MKRRLAPKGLLVVSTLVSAVAWSSCTARPQVRVPEGKSRVSAVQVPEGKSRVNDPDVAAQTS